MMAKFGQILYKIGKNFNDWNGREVYRLTKVEFVRIMKAKGYPQYDARKTINEKWASFHDYYKLVQNHGETEELGEWILINSEAAKREIDDCIPDKYRGTIADRKLYLMGRA